MAIIDIFKRKKKVEKPKEVEEPLKVKVEKEAKKPKKRKLLERAEVKPGVPKPKAKIPEIAYRILKSPRITEKAAELLKKNQYVFQVSSRANKIEVKKAIENLYGVNVLNVRIINIPKKPRRLGRQRGWREGYKKAIIKIKEGQKIEVLPR